MLLIPAIDLKNGCCVRLKQGNINNVTLFSKNPYKMVKHWLIKGARRLHIVDLDGAFSGIPKNYFYIKKILKIVNNFSNKNNYHNIPVQLGGGIRDIKTIENYIKCGVSNIIIGTAAIKNRIFLKKAFIEFPNKIIVSIDSKNELVATDGWEKISSLKLIDLVNEIVDIGCKNIIYTDINRDGMMVGVNIDTIFYLAKKIPISIIVSGGVNNFDNIKKICNLSCNNITGIICGRSIYENKLDFKLAQNYIDSI